MDAPLHRGLRGFDDLLARAMRCLVALFLISTLVHAEPARPNIVYIVADDLGWKDVGFHGSDIKTPNLDQLAKTGARTRRSSTSQPMCTPTRAALMTGRYPHALRTADGGHPVGRQVWPRHGRVPAAAGAEGGGLRTAIVGKWHLGHADTELLAAAARLRLLTMAR